MKRTIFTTLLVGGCLTMFAQNTQTTNNQNAIDNQNQVNQTMDQSSTNQSSTTTPAMNNSAGNDYNSNGNMNSDNMNSSSMNSAYSGQSSNVGSMAAIPVLQSFVPSNVVSMASQKYPSIYSISSVKAANGQNAYAIGVIENGTLKTEWLGEDGNVASNIWRTDDLNASDSMNSSQSNAAMDSDYGNGPVIYDITTTNGNATMDMSNSTDMRNDRNNGTPQKRLNGTHKKGTKNHGNRNSNSNSSTKSSAGY